MKRKDFPIYPSKAKAIISIIVPTYNYGNYISKTIESLLSQSYNFLDIVIVDDGSTDNTFDVINYFKDSRIRYFYQKNQAANVARNRGISEAKGELIIFLDSDDLLEPTHIEEYLKVALSNPGANIYGPWAKGWYENNEFKVDFSKGKCPDDDLLTCWIGNWWIQTCCIMWSRKTIEKIGGWDETLHADQDGDIAMRALMEGVPFVFAENAPIAKITMHNEEIQSISATTSKKTLDSRKRVLEKIESLLKEREGIDPDRKKAFAQKYYYLACISKSDFPEMSDLFYKKYRKFQGYGKPPGNLLDWLMTSVFGWRYKEKFLHRTNILKKKVGF